MEVELKCSDEDYNRLGSWARKQERKLIYDWEIEKLKFHALCTGNIGVYKYLVGDPFEVKTKNKKLLLIK